MSRRIETGTADSLPPDALRLGRGKRPQADDYLGRLAKYIPAEIVGLYLATAGVVPAGQNGQPRCVALWIIFAVNLLLVPIYFWFATSRENHKPLGPQVILATIAFPVWVFAVGGPFKCFSWYESWIASATLAFVTVGMGFYRPKPGS